jgi:hypothetical protein
VTFWAWRRWSRRRDTRPHPAASFLDELERHLERAHIARQDGEGLEELSRRLAARQHPASAALSKATRRYLEARFGQRPLSSTERRALLTALDQGLTPSEKRRTS